MPVLTMPSVSTQPVQQQVSALLNGAAYNFSADAAYMAFIAQPAYGPPPNPGSSDWHTASVEVDAGPTYWVSCLVGSANGGVVLAAGVYQIFIKVTDNPAVPVLAGWQLAIT